MHLVKITGELPELNIIYASFRAYFAYLVWR